MRRNPCFPAFGATQVSFPVLPFRPGSAELVWYDQFPSTVGVKRSLKALSPSQNPVNVLVTPPGPAKLALTVAAGSV